MVSTFINPLVNPEANLGVSQFDETAPLQLWRNHSESDVDLVIRAAYRQVLGNAYVMESERLIVAESQLKQGNLSVREFVRQIALSEQYRARFFEPCPRMRLIELNFKHLLGRAPESAEEMADHAQLLDRGGFEMEINNYIDSDEYHDAFGEDTVPYYRGHKSQIGKKMVGFTHMFQLLRGSASSDKDPSHQNRSRLNSCIFRNRPSAIAPLKGAAHSPYGKLKVSDTAAILAEVFKPKTSGVGQTQSWATSANFAAEQALRQTLLDQDLIIESLQKQLADLRPSASIGASYIKTAWHPTVVFVQGDASDSLLQQSDNQIEQIANLQSQIADARRYAAIGDARLNKWRSRVFNS
ncbi:phycobilisome rod linker polypeptide-like [Pseudanabaena sp. lw0831]|uniref:phycobilisome rod-core linker polypeptide n=1 Tax=Pseudanabaena sp. lw0831 TaxID=1357935 RepID=UPI0019166F96|nr:phycobilisome rod-core linker polypeptide [Pseudanabaena sp. lw0831]GBO52806.1 phycobilisome rod linker polypeptide-like [Pseudanabaena sp. lw0831]